MATGKQGFVRATDPQQSASIQREKEMHVQAPQPAMYIQAVPSLPTYPQAQPAAVQDAAVIPLSVPMMYTNPPLPFLTLHIASGAGLQQQRPEMPASSPRPKSAGKHVCPHCGKDCLKPSVLEKHLRCHTGERPYPCTTCGISFKTQSNLYKHKRTQAHARLSSESGKGTFSSQESTESSRENCSSPSVELQNEDSCDTNRSDAVLSTAATSTGSLKEVTTGSETEWALCKAAVVGVIASPAHGQQIIPHTATQKVRHLQTDGSPLHSKSPTGDGRAPLTPNRTPLQRQEALFPKSQSHDSTDSGFSESTEQHSTSSPGAVMHDPSMELEEPETLDKLADMGTDDMKSKVSLQDKQKLEKHILKLISENSVVMDDKHLVNVRPRKTVLSKQGSIDLPMPYTYKDSFHFEIGSSKNQASGLQDRKGRPFYSSMPTQHSTSLEHAPLTRSSSLPFSIGIPNSDTTVSPCEVDNINLSRRCSAGHIYPFKSVDQHTPSQRSLVRQVAVDGLSAVEGSLMERNSLSSLSSDGDCADSASESAVKRCRRKKAQKFAYNKWYMYGGGTFKKLYNIEKDAVLKSRKAALSPEQTENQGTQISRQKDSNLSGSGSVSYTTCSTPSLSPFSNVLTAQTSSQGLSSYLLVQNTPIKQPAGQPQQSLTKQTNAPCSDLMNAAKGTEEKGRAPEAQLATPAPSERKKQKTDEHLSDFVKNTEGLQRDTGSSLNRQGSFSNLSSSSNQRHLLFKRHSSPLFVANMTGTSVTPSASSSISSVSQAKTSFLPKYQLKIPVLTDGTSDPCLGKSSSQNPPSPRQNVSLNQQPGTTSKTTPANQSTTTVTSFGQEQETLTVPAITTATSMTSVMYDCQNAHAYTSAFTSTTTGSLACPLAFTNLSACVSTTHSSHISPLSHSSASTKISQVQNNPVKSIAIPTQSPGVTPAWVHPSSAGGISLEISSSDVQGTQDTFYVQTEDLQIVMQLISDEQLALIEPQIETQNYKATESQLFLSKCPETSTSGSGRKGVSEEINKQYTGDTRSKLVVEQRNVNRSVLSNIPDITLTSSGSEVAEQKAKSSKNTQDVYITNTGATGVISRSPPKAEHDCLMSADSRALGQQCKMLSLTPEGRMVPKESGTVWGGTSASSYHKQKPSEKIAATNESEGNTSFVPRQILKNCSTSIICNAQQSSQDTTSSQGTICTIVTLTNTPAKSSEGKLMKEKVATLPEISERSPNHQLVQATVQQHKSLLKKAVEKQMEEINTSNISVASSALGLHPTVVSTSTQDGPIKTKSLHSSGAGSTIARAISSKSVLAPRAYPQQPLNQTGACNEDRLNHEENQTLASGQSGQYSARLDRSEPEQVKVITTRTAHMASAQMESRVQVSSCLKEETMKRALGPGGMLHTNQDSFSWPPMYSSLQNVSFQWEAETGSQTKNSLESKSRGRDGTEWVGTWDTKNIWTKMEEDDLESKGEAAKSTESCHKVVNPHLEISTSQRKNNVNAATSDSVSISTTSANPSQDGKYLPNIRENSLGGNVAPKQMDQRSTKGKDHVSLGHCESFIPLSRGSGDGRHLLAHPILVNTIQKEVQQETRTKNSACRMTHSTSLQMQSPLAEQEADGTAQISMLNEACSTSPFNTEQCQIIKTTPTYTGPSCSNQTNSPRIHPHPICATNIHNDSIDSNAPHGYMEEQEQQEEEEEEEEEGEERSSSSDDEGKLVIELE